MVSAIRASLPTQHDEAEAFFKDNNSPIRISRFSSKEATRKKIAQRQSDDGGYNQKQPSGGFPVQKLTASRFIGWINAVFFY